MVLCCPMWQLRFVSLGFVCVWLGLARQLWQGQACSVSARWGGVWFVMVRYAKAVKARCFGVLYVALSSVKVRYGLAVKAMLVYVGVVRLWHVEQWRGNPIDRKGALWYLPQPPAVAVKAMLGQ